MRQAKREKRDREIFFYRTGYNGTYPHTLFECALHFDLSVNQIHLNIKKFKNKVANKARLEGVPASAQEYGVSTMVVERLLEE